MAMIKTCSTPPIAFPEVSGPVCSFKALQALPLKKCEVAINAWQEGSGDPSPSNVRAIHGFSEVNATRCGVNMWDEDWELGSISNTTGKNTEATRTYRTKNYIPLQLGTNYYMYIGGNYTLGLRFYNINKNFISSRPITVSGILRWNSDIPAQARFMRFVNVSTNTYANDISINYPSTDTAYHAYTGNTYTIQLGQEVYGAEVDVVNGVAHVNKVYFYLTGDDIAAYGTSGGGINYINFVVGVVSVVNSINALCNQYMWSSTAGEKRARVFGLTSNSTVVRIYDTDRFPDEATAKTEIDNNPIEIVIPLAEPIDIQLTPTQIETLIGNNTIFADTGDTAVQYIKIGG